MFLWSKGMERTRKVIARESRCITCRYYAPYHLYPRIGVCNNPISQYYNYPVLATLTACEDFDQYSAKREELVEHEYYWCEDCLISIPGFLYDEHADHRVRNKLASTDIEFNVESTYAAD